MAKKGYACVDGISLTIVEVDRTRGQISFNIIPHTMKATTMHVKSPGDIINIEADCMAKMLSSYMDCVLQDRDSILMSSIEEAIERKLGKS